MDGTDQICSGWEMRWGGFAARVRSGHGLDDCALGSWIRLSLVSGHGMDLMMGWDQIISLGWDVYHQDWVEYWMDE